MGIVSSLDQTWKDIANDDLVRDLYNELYRKLKNPPSRVDKPTNNDLSDIMLLYAKEQFSNRYAYDFNMQNSKPPKLKSGGKMEPFQKNGYIKNSDDIASAVNAALASVSFLTPDTQAQANSDLNAVTNNIYTKPGSTNITWYSDSFHKQYNDSDPKNPSVMLDGQMVYCNAYLNWLGTVASFTVIEYVGIFYEVDNPNEEATNNLLTDLYNGIPEVKSITGSVTFQMIQQAWEIPATKKFQDKLAYPFNGQSTNPPDKSGNLYGNNNTVLDITNYIPGNKKGDVTLEQYLWNALLISMNIPESRRDAIKKDLAIQVASQFSTTTGNSWSGFKVSDKFDSAAAGIQTVQHDAAVYYTNAERSQTGADVRRVYMVYIGVIYDTPSPIAQVENALYSALAKSANGFLDSPVSYKEPPSAATLVDIVRKLGTSKFGPHFQYPWQEEGIHPTNAIPNAQNVYGTPVAQSIELTNDKQLKGRIRVILQGMGVDVDGWAGKKLHKNLEEEITALLDGAQATFQDTPYEWHSDSPQTKNNKQRYTLKFDSYIMYSSITEDLGNGKTINVQWLYIVGALYKLPFQGDDED